VATAGQVIPAAKNATRTIPIVTIVAVDPVETGLVASLARPGGNITGLTFTVGPEIAGKRLELLKEAVPRAFRVAVLWNPTYPGGGALLRACEKISSHVEFTLGRRG
jgi:putative ABC transport system substrate-binding protein